MPDYMIKDGAINLGDVDDDGDLDAVIFNRNNATPFDPSNQVWLNVPTPEP